MVLIILKYCIIGGGAIGGLLAYFLYRAGINDITVYYGSWDSVREISYNGGITIISKGRDYLVPIKPRHYTMPGEKCDVILCAVKAYDVKKTLDLIKDLAYEYSLIVSLQNGFGSYELLAREFGYNRVALGVVNIGAYRVNKYTIEERGIGEIIFGQKQGFHYLLPELALRLRIGGCPTRITVFIDKYRWLKLAINAVINPLTALMRAKNRIIYESKHLREIAYLILKELVIAAKITDNIDLDLNRLYKYVLRIVEITKENYSSMVQDILNNRRTEIDYINGFIVEVLEKHGLNPIANKIITELIHAVEERLIQPTQ
ncbi:MAG: ketopantoate reductase family protein [Thermoprotei archaeon]|nr:MAG: ketopantoate reductase family protein [Thermoprotei archaeon]